MLNYSNLCIVEPDISDQEMVCLTIMMRDVIRIRDNLCFSDFERGDDVAIFANLGFRCNEFD